VRAGVLEEGVFSREDPNITLTLHQKDAGSQSNRQQGWKARKRGSRISRLQTSRRSVGLAENENVGLLFSFPTFPPTFKDIKNLL